MKIPYLVTSKAIKDFYNTTSTYRRGPKVETMYECKPSHSLNDAVETAADAANGKKKCPHPPSNLHILAFEQCGTRNPH